MARRQLRLDMDFTADPVWRLFDDHRGHVMVRLDSLPLTQSLKARLRQWADEWESWNTAEHLLDQNIPPAVEFAAWEQQGRVLAADVQLELGPEYQVAYGLPRRP